MAASHDTDPQSPPKNTYWSWTDIKGRTREIFGFLPDFLKNPVEGIKKVPSWDWPTAILLEILLSMITGSLAGLISRSFIGVVFGLIIAPLMGVIFSFVFAGVFYYACLFILKTQVEFRKMFIIVVMAKIPYQILGILTPIVNLITLLSIIVYALLLIVGISENFLLERKKVAQIVGGIAGLCMVIWLYSMAVNINSNRIKVQEYNNDSLDQLHKELTETK